MIKDRLFNSTLEIEINLIGYDSLGESIVFFIKTDGQIDYVGVVDSYCRGQINKTLEMVKKVGRCDFLCWTHAHMDHSKGIAEVIKFCDEGSNMYITPAVYPKLLLNSKSASKEIKAVRKQLKGIMSKKNSKKLKLSRVSEAKKLCEIRYRSNNNKYKIVISSFCPNDYQLTQRDFLKQKNDNNISSIGLNIEAGLYDMPSVYNIILAGDVEDASLKYIPDYIGAFVKPTYIKIPHHASSSAKFLLNLLSDEDLSNLHIATTTVFEQNKLPDKDILLKYHQLTDKGVDIYVTKDISCTRKNKEKYGIVRTVFDICDDLGQEIDSYTYGDASIWL